MVMMTLHIMLGLSIGALGANPCYDSCHASAHAVAERPHSYLRDLYQRYSSHRTTNLIIKMLQLVARAAHFRAKG